MGNANGRYKDVMGHSSNTKLAHSSSEDFLTSAHVGDMGSATNGPVGVSTSAITRAVPVLRL
jgi:hypothetical protein